MFDRNSIAALRVHSKHRMPMVNAGILATLRAHPGIQIADESNATQGPVEVVVIDYEGGLNLARVRSFDAKGPRLLIFTDTDRESDVRAAFEAGISGYVLYDCSSDELLWAVASLGRGERHFCTRVVERMADSLRHDALTRREHQVLSLMIRGLSNKLIARELAIALATVKTHANAVYGKLHTSSRLEAVAIAVARGIGSCSEPSRQEQRPHASAGHPLGDRPSA